MAGSWIENATLTLAEGAQAAAALLIGLATAEALVRSLLGFGTRFRRRDEPVSVSTESIRLGLGSWLALALEFALAADILKTAVAPSWNEIGQLAAIVVLRTTLNFFLQREIEKARPEDAGRKL